MKLLALIACAILAVSICDAAAKAIEPASSGQSGAPIKRCPDLERYYPEREQRMGLGGTARWRFTLDETGKATEFQLVSSSGSDTIDLAAQRYLATCRFDAPAGTVTARAVRFTPSAD